MILRFFVLSCSTPEPLFRPHDPGTVLSPILADIATRNCSGKSLYQFCLQMSA
jgi:hypothetical protein